MPNTHRRAAMALVIAALLFSTGGAAIKAAHFTGWQIASLRAGVAGITLIALMPGARRGWGWRPALVGSAYAVTCICFVLATRLTTSANAIFIQSASPLYVLLLAPLLLREPVAWRDVLLMLPIGVGLGLFLWGGQRPAVTAPNPAAGNLIATLSGLSFAFSVIGFRWLGRSGGVARATPLTAAAIGNFLACAVALPMTLPLGRHPAGDWAILLYLGVFQIGLAYWFVSYAITRLSALETSVLLLLEPALNPVWSWLVHGEVPGGAALVGGALVLGATLARALWSEPENPAPKPLAQT
jgi:drug/metabolite transporter (DMT)-like permease